MPLPGDVATIVVTGTYLDMFGNPQSGTVTFTPSTPLLVDSGSDTILGGAPVTVALTAGGVSATLPCTSGLTPPGWVWQVTENTSAAPQRTYAVVLPSTLGSTVDLSTLTPVAVMPAVTPYLLASELGTPNGPAELNVAGALPIAQGGTGSTSALAALRALGASAADWVSVTSAAYGADPTGATDSSAAFQAALAQVAANGGGCLYIPAGIYLVGTALTYTANHPLRITGDGPAASVILANNGTSSVVYLTVTSTSRVTLDNFSVNNNVNSPAFSDVNVGIELSGVTYASITNVTMQTAGASNRINTCFILNNCTNINFYGCDLRSYVNGIVMQGTTAAVSYTSGSFGQNTGSGVATAASILMTGSTATLGLTNVLFNAGDRALLLTGGSGANPSFVWGYNVQVNNTVIAGFEFDTGAEVWMDGAWVTSNASGTASNGLLFGSGFQGEAYFGKSLFSGWSGHTVAINGGKGFTFEACQFGDSGGGKTTANTYDMINMAGTGLINIFGCQFNDAPYAGFGTTKPRSAVNITSGVVDYHVNDNFFNSAGSYGTASCIDGNASPQRFGFKNNAHGFDYKDAGSGQTLSAISTAETILCQLPVDPQDLLSGATFEFKIFGQYTNGATSQSNNFRLRAGTAGTTSDTQVVTLGNTSYTSTTGSTNIFITGQLQLQAPGAGGTGKGWLQGFESTAGFGGASLTNITASASSWNTTTSVWLTLTFQTGNALNTLAVTNSSIAKIV